MANYFNLIAAPLTFLGASALAYGLWEPVLSFLAFFPTPLYVMVGTMWIAINFLGIVIMPFIMLVSDDQGN